VTSYKWVWLKRNGEARQVYTVQPPSKALAQVKHFLLGTPAPLGKKMLKLSVMSGYWTMSDDKVVVGSECGNFRYEYKSRRPTEEKNREHLRHVWSGYRMDDLPTNDN